MVVEEEALVRLTIADYLRDCGYAVAEAADTNEALEIFASGEPVDVVFTDVQMHGALDGLMLVRWVDSYPGIQVLVTSGKGDAALSSGLIPYHAFFSKPYALEESGGSHRLIALMIADKIFYSQRIVRWCGSIVLVANPYLSESYTGAKFRQ